ncbi:MAG: GNAT family N-acetyltransferase [Thermoplasmata archaeon]
MTIREAVILAAGKGKRMKSNTSDETLRNTPKPLIEINGIPIIEYQLRDLFVYGMDVAIVINKNDEALFKEKLKNYNVKYYYQIEPKGTADALYSARDFVKNDLFLVLMGDDIAKLNMEEVINIDYPVVFGYEIDEIKNYGAIEVDENDLIVDIIEKKKKGRGIANTGIYIMPKSFFNIYKDIKINDKANEFFLTDSIQVFKKININFHLKKLKLWYGVNTPDELAFIRNIFNGSIYIRKAMLEDYTSLMNVLSQLSIINDESSSNNNGLDTFKEILRDPNYIMCVAETKEGIVGTATLLVQLNLSHGSRPYGHIENVVVDINHRRKGIGKMMLKFLFRKAYERNCYKIVLSCNHENIEFYKSIGFYQTGEIEMRINIK